MPARSSVEKPTSQQGRFDSLFDSHHDLVYRYCLRRLGPVDAEDAAADVFAIAWRRIDRIPGGDLTRSWLIGVAYKVVGNRYRARRRQARLWTRLVSTTEPGSDPFASAHTADAEVQRLYMALSALSATDQELLRLSAWDGMSRGEIARVLDINENALDQRLHRARARLKARLESDRESNDRRETRT